MKSKSYKIKSPTHLPVGQDQSARHNLFSKKVLSTAIASVIAGGGVPAYAQDGTQMMEEIVVTVNRREQNLQDVSGTVQAFNGDDLLKIGINSDFQNLQYAVPGLQIANQEGKVEVFLRGIGSSDSDFSSDPSVATHYNGVYLPRPRGIGPLFFDSERVEVNKGPQGTIRGRNATGGTINIISNRPEFDSVNGEVAGGVGNFGGSELQGVINVPVTDSFAFRAAIWAKKHDGLYSNAFNDGGALRTPSSQDDVAGRIHARWEPTDTLALDFQYFNASVESSGDPGAFAGRSLSAGYDIDDLDDPWNQYFRSGGNYEQDINTVILKVTNDWDSFGVEYSGSFNKLEAYNANASREWQLGMNYPGSEVEAAYIASGANPQRNLQVNDTFYQADTSASMTHEVRFYSAGDSALTWTAGAFYFEEEFDYVSWDVGNGFCGGSNFLNAEAPLGPSTISCWQNGLGGENRGDDSEVETMAFYFDGTYELNDRTRFIFGIRATSEEKNQRDFNAQYQFDFNADFFNDFPGINENTDLVIGEPGFRLTDPGSRTITDAVPGTGALDLFVDGIASFGLSDNWGDFLQACEEGTNCQVTVSSSFDDESGSIRANNSVEDDYIDWRLGVEYDLNDGSGSNNLETMTYLTISTGHRSGGINRPLILGPGRRADVTWEPEELVVYELGAKNTFFLGDYGVRLNSALFYYDYSDYVAQLLVDVPNPTPQDPDGVTQQVLTDNVSDATILGLEVEGNVDLPFNMNLNASLLLLDSEFENSAILDPRTGDNNVINVDGNQLPNVSKVGINARLSQTIDIDSEYVSSFDWTVNVNYRSKFYLSPFNSKGYELDANGNTVEIPLTDMPAPNNNGALATEPYAEGQAVLPNARFFSDQVGSVAIVNLNAGINFGDAEQFRLDAYVENVFEEAYSTKAFVNSSVNIRYLNSPRIFGVRFRSFF